MNPKFIEQIQKMDLDAIENNPEIDIAGIMENAMHRLSEMFPFYSAEYWELYNFNFNYDIESLADSQIKIINEMNMGFINIYENLLRKACEN